MTRDELLLKVAKGEISAERAADLLGGFPSRLARFTGLKRGRPRKPLAGLAALVAEWNALLAKDGPLTVVERDRLTYLSDRLAKVHSEEYLYADPDEYEVRLPGGKVGVMARSSTHHVDPVAYQAYREGNAQEFVNHVLDEIDELEDVAGPPIGRFGQSSIIARRATPASG